MSATEGRERRADKKDGLMERLHDPTQLRVVLMLIVLAIGYGAIFMPFDKVVADARRDLAQSEKLLKLAGEVDLLRKEYRLVETRLAKSTDSNEWMQYVLEKIRQSPLTLVSFNPGVVDSLGPYKVVTLKIKLSGAFGELDEFLCWIESNPRLFRVNNIALGAVRGKDKATGRVEMELTVLGLMG